MKGIKECCGKISNLVHARKRIFFSLFIHLKYKKFVKLSWLFLIGQKHPMSEVENRETNSAKKYVEFRRVWVDELLAVCRDQNKLSDSFRVNAGFINYIKVLFKVDPNCFQYIMAVAQEMDLTLTVKLMIIKSAIDQNLFAITPYKSQFRLHQHEHSLQDGHHVRNWRGIVSMAVMHEAVWSYSSQVCCFKGTPRELKTCQNRG